MPSRRVRRTHNIARGGIVKHHELGQDFPGDKICNCGHPEGFHIKLTLQGTRTGCISCNCFLFLEKPK